MSVDMAAYRRAYPSERPYDYGCFDEGLIAAVEVAIEAARSERAAIIAARNLVHAHCCPITSWHCGDDVAGLARHRAMYRAQAVAMIAAIGEAQSCRS